MVLNGPKRAKKSKQGLRKVQKHQENIGNRNMHCPHTEFVYVRKYVCHPVFFENVTLQCIYVNNFFFRSCFGWRSLLLIWRSASNCLRLHRTRFNLWKNPCWFLLRSRTGLHDNSLVDRTLVRFVLHCYCGFWPVLICQIFHAIYWREFCSFSGNNFHIWIAEKTRQIERQIQSSWRISSGSWRFCRRVLSLQPSRWK